MINEEYQNEYIKQHKKIIEDILQSYLESVFPEYKGKFKVVFNE
jgi:hypothetical protein